MNQKQTPKEIDGYNRYYAYKKGYRDGVNARAYDQKVKDAYPIEYCDGYGDGRIQSNDAMLSFLKRHKLKPPSPLRTV